MQMKNYQIIEGEYFLSGEIVEKTTGILSANLVDKVRVVVSKEDACSEVKGEDRERVELRLPDSLLKYNSVEEILDQTSDGTLFRLYELLTKGNNEKWYTKYFLNDYFVSKEIHTTHEEIDAKNLISAKIKKILSYEEGAENVSYVIWKYVRDTVLRRDVIEEK